MARLCRSGLDGRDEQDQPKEGHAMHRFRDASPMFPVTGLNLSLGHQPRQIAEAEAQQPRLTAESRFLPWLTT